ncbi:protein kinase [Candidatus Sumerlaeota bacterium]|nr:protein kinase [Candidatus Sumerlaeota bacterium]
MNRLEASAELRYLEECLRQTPEDADLHLQRADLYYRTGIFCGDALQVYEKAVDLFPENDTAQRAMSVCYLIQNIEDIMAVGDAIQNGDGHALEQYQLSIEELLNDLPHSADLLKVWADLRLMRGDQQGAFEAYQRALRQDPEAMAGFVATGALAARLDTLNSDLAYLLGDVMRKIGRAAEAFRILKRALDEGGVKIAQQLTQLLEKDLIPHADPPQQHSYRMELCSLYLMADNPMEALRVFRMLDPDRSFTNVRLIKGLSHALIQMEDYRAAFDCIKRIPIDEEAKQMLNQIAVALEKRGELDAAGYLLHFINRNDLVIQEAEQLKEIETERTAQIAMGDLSLKNKRYERALESYITALKLGATEGAEIFSQIDLALLHIEFPKTEHLAVLSEYCLEAGKHLSATRYLKRGYEIDPDNEELIIKLRRCFDILLRRDPDSPEILLQSAQLHLRQKEFSKAIEQLKTASTFPERQTEAYLRLIKIYTETGDLVDALELARQLPMSQDLQPLLYGLHTAYESAGQLHRAYEVAHMLDSFNPDYRDIRARTLALQERLSRMAREDAEATHSNLRDPKMIELIGEAAAGRYQYIEKIGSGGMGVVHKVYDLQNNRKVAMKILRDSLTSSRKAVDRFFREANIAATLDHPNIVQIFEINPSRDSEHNYISMEFVDGPSLRDILEERLQKSSELDESYISQMVYYMAQLCSALEATHAKGIIHRDIKPDNILITSNHVAKITDFGIVHLDNATFTPTGALIGTPRYMSPEQVQGYRIDGRSDIYATGIILYEMLVGTPPFISGDIAFQHVNIQPTPLRDFSSVIPKEIDAITMKCLEKKPEHRYNDARELKVELADILQNLFPEYPQYVTLSPEYTSGFDNSSFDISKFDEMD